MPDTLAATVERAETLAPDVRELTLRPDGPPLGYAPGQWLSLRLPVGEKPPLVRAYSLATPAEPDGALTLCFDRVPGGLGSEYLWSLAPGDRVEFAGPVGNFVLPPEGAGDLVFAARYTGIVPFRAMLRAMDSGAEPARRVRLVYGAHHAEELIYHAELTDLAARASWFEYHPTVAEPGGGWTGAVGDEMALLQTHARGWLPCVPMVCGVREFTLPVRGFFQELGLERRAVKIENYSGPAAAAR